MCVCCECVSEDGHVSLIFLKSDQLALLYDLTCLSDIEKEDEACLKTLYKIKIFENFVNLCQIECSINECISRLISWPSDERHEGWLKCKSTRVLTSPNAVQNSVNLSNTRFITYIYTSFYLFFWNKYFNIFIWIISNVNLNLLPCFFAEKLVRRFTLIKIMTKNIDLVLCFVTVLYNIVNMSYKLNIVQNSNTFKVFLNLNEEETKPFLTAQ